MPKSKYGVKLSIQDRAAISRANNKRKRNAAEISKAEKEMYKDFNALFKELSPAKKRRIVSARKNTLFTDMGRKPTRGKPTGSRDRTDTRLRPPKR